MKLYFAGTPEFAVPSLESLMASSHEVCGVLTQPDRPAGRGKKLSMSAIKERALELKLPVHQPENLRGVIGQEVVEMLQNVDVLVVVAYGLILPDSILNACHYGCINLHPSRLPSWRGAAPIQHTLLNGERDTAITIMQMDRGMDSGDILLQVPYPVLEHETSGELHARLAKLGAIDLVQALDQLEQGAISPVPQDHDSATYTKKIHKKDAKLDWSLPATTLENQVRAYSPWPVSFAEINGERLRVWRATARPFEVSDVERCKPGLVVEFNEAGLDVLTGEGVLSITELQRPGGKRITIQDFYHGNTMPLTVGETKLS